MNKELKQEINGAFKKKYRGHPRFYEILEEMKILHDRKNYQYSCDSDPLSNFKSAGRMVEKLFKPNINVPLKGETLRSIELESIKEVRHRLGMKPLHKVKGEHYTDYLKDFEKRKYSAELLRFKLGK